MSRDRLVGVIQNNILVISDPNFPIHYITFMRLRWRLRGEFTRAVATRSIMGRTACEPWSMRIVNDGSPAPTFWSFVLGHDNLSPVEQQRHWLEDTDSLELIRCKDVSIVSINKISEVIVSNCLSLMLWSLQLYYNSFWMKECDIFRGQNITWPLLHIFRGHDPHPIQDLRPWRTGPLADACIHFKISATTRV